MITQFVKKIVKSVLHKTGILEAPSTVEPGGKEKFDLEYKTGKWDYLADLSELSRFSVIVGYCHFLKKHPKILEVGSGEGTLSRRLCTSKFKSYTGVDFSEEAIKKAMKSHDLQSQFIISDAMNYEPDEKFDIIIFNECLIYFEHPDHLLKRFEPYLNPDGIYIVSIYDEGQFTKRIWNKISKGRKCLTKTRVQNELGYVWDIKVFKVETM